MLVDFYLRGFSVGEFCGLYASLVCFVCGLYVSLDSFVLIVRLDLLTYLFVGFCGCVFWCSLCFPDLFLILL